MKEKASVFLLGTTTRSIFHRWCAVVYKSRRARRSAGERQKVATRGLMKACMAALRSFCRKRQMLRRVFSIFEQRWSTVADELDNPYRVDFHLMLGMVTKWREFAIRCRRARHFVAMNHVAVKFASTSLVARAVRAWKRVHFITIHAKAMRKQALLQIASDCFEAWSDVAASQKMNIAQFREYWDGEILKKAVVAWRAATKALRAARRKRYWLRGWAIAVREARLERQELAEKIVRERLAVVARGSASMAAARRQRRLRRGWEMLEGIWRAALGRRRDDDDDDDHGDSDRGNYGDDKENVMAATVRRKAAVLFTTALQEAKGNNDEDSSSKSPLSEDGSRRNVVDDARPAALPTAEHMTAEVAPLLPPARIVPSADDIERVIHLGKRRVARDAFRVWRRWVVKRQEHFFSIRSSVKLVREIRDGKAPASALGSSKRKGKVARGGRGKRHRSETEAGQRKRSSSPRKRSSSPRKRSSSPRKRSLSPRKMLALTEEDKARGLTRVYAAPKGWYGATRLTAPGGSGSGSSVRGSVPAEVSVSVSGRRAIISPQRRRRGRVGGEGAAATGGSLQGPRGEWPATAYVSSKSGIRTLHVRVPKP